MYLRFGSNMSNIILSIKCYILIQLKIQKEKDFIFILSCDKWFLFHKILLTQDICPRGKVNNYEKSSFGKKYEKDGRLQSTKDLEVLLLQTEVSYSMSFICPFACWLVQGLEVETLAK